MKDNIPLQGHQMVHFDICLEKKKKHYQLAENTNQPANHLF